MGTIGYYIALPFIYGISMLPFRLLYVLSDLMNFVLFGVIGYRKQVVMTNQRNSFPEKSETELQAIAKRFYSWFCDLTLETLKTLTISPEALKERVTLHGIEILKNYAQRDQSIIIVLGHFGNWELAGARYSHEPGLPQLYVIYHPLQNKHFDALILKMRTRHGTRLYSMREASKSMLRDRHLLTATAFIADQTPSPERAFWLTFMNQKTPVFQGTENLAKKLGYPVVYISITRPRRGHYNMKVETLVETPTNTQEGEITKIHTQRLEQDIKENSDIWLWTHKRWKHRGPLHQA